MLTEADLSGANLERALLVKTDLSGCSLAGCRVSSLATTYANDLDVPTVGDGFFYVVSRVAAGAEGSLGRRSDGTERDIDTRCP